MFEKVQAIVAEELGVEKDEVTKEANIIDDLGADSLDTVELIMALEEEFDIEVADDQAQSLKTIQDVINYIEKLQ